MEKTITINKVIQFVRDSMTKRYEINLYSNNLRISRAITLIDENGDKINTRRYFEFAWKIQDNKLTINVGEVYFPSYVIEEEDEELVLRWQLLISSVKNYVNANVETAFYNFFSEESEVTKIDDLDNDED